MNKHKMLYAFVAMTMLAVSFGWSKQAHADMGEPPFNRLTMFEELEYGLSQGSNSVSWDGSSWMGGDWHRVWIKTEGEVAAEDEFALDGEAQLLYSRLISAFWDLQVGVRGDLMREGGSTDGRGFLVLGLEGLAPYWFEVEPAIFVSHQGDVSARLRASYELFITQRLIAHPSFETNVAVQSVADVGVGRGLNDVELGLRLGYQFAREFAPYIGISWKRSFFETARMLRDANQDLSELQGVAGVRVWF